MDNPNIIQYYADGKTNDGELCVVLEKMDKTLKDRIEEQKGKQLDEFKVWYYFIQIVRGATYLNYYNIVHLDLKPDNILVKTTPSGPLVKISDFGNSKEISPEGAGGEYFKEGVATFRTMPPEMIQGKKFGK